VSPRFRDPDGTQHHAPSGEHWTDRVIREARDRGEFEDLPLHGKRLPVQDETYAGDMALAYHVLKNAGVAPPWIEADKEARRLLAERDTILEQAEGAGVIAAARYRRRLAQVVVELNAAIARVNAEAPLSAHRARLNAAAEMEELERRLARRS
jgi:hypothetical protein